MKIESVNTKVVVIDKLDLNTNYPLTYRGEISGILSTHCFLNYDIAQDIYKLIKFRKYEDIINK